jgi:C1A family cysteine protease
MAGGLNMLINMSHRQAVLKQKKTTLILPTKVKLVPVKQLNLNMIAVSSYNTIKGESATASYVQKTGPLSVCVDASTWNSYNGGIMKSCGKKVNHCVQAVGVDASSSGYWKLRSSWGTKSGESGFIRLAYGQDMCAITNDPTYAVVKKL